MKYAASNIGLTAYDHLDELPRLAALGIQGLEVSPSRVWPDWWHGLKATDVAAYRRAVEAAGLRVIGLHTLFWQQDRLGLFREPEARTETQDYLVHLAQLCADLGGAQLVFGSGRARMRGALSLEDANLETVRFFSELAPRIDGLGVCFAFEALGPTDSDYINSIRDALVLIDALPSPVMRTHLDAKALVQAGEVDAETFALAAPSVVHFHANEPDLGVLGTSGEIDHAVMGSLLRGIGYDGYVSIEQRMVSDTDPLADIARSAQVLMDNYG